MKKKHRNRQSLILECAKELKFEFSTEDLIVHCWQQHPKEFGLGNYPYPSSTKVRCRVNGERGLIAQGYLSCKKGVLKVTEKGLSTKVAKTSRIMLDEY